MGEKALFVHSQANRDTRPHLIGRHFYTRIGKGGKFSDPSPPLTRKPRPSPVAVPVAWPLTSSRQPGTLCAPNHNLIDAVLLGAAAHMNVEGKWNDDLMIQLRKPNENSTPAMDH